MGTTASRLRQAERYRACVLHADACDYTARLIQNEQLTIAGILAARRLIVGMIRRFSGHIADQSGDNVLAWFIRPDAAVECALAIQKGLGAQAIPGRAADLPQFRIGVALGDILNMGRQIFGTAITEAARLQTLAAPGRVVVSWEVKEACTGRQDLATAEPIRAVLKPNEPTRYGFELLANRASNTSHRKVGHAPLVIITPLMAPTGDSQAISHAALFLQSLLECIYRERAEATVTDDYSAAMRAIGTDTGAPVYWVTGGIHTSGENVVVSVSTLHGHVHRLVNAERTTLPLGATAFNEIQTFAERVFRAIVINECDIFQNIKSVPKGAFHLYSKARLALAKLSDEGVGEAIAALEECLRFEPDFARGWGLLGKAHSLAWRFSWKTGARDSLAQSVALTSRALEIAPQDPVTLAQGAFALIWARETARAQEAYHDAIALGLSDPDEISEYAMILQSRNEGAEAVSLLLGSLRSNPENPDFRLWTLGDIYFTTKRYKDALNTLGRMRNIGQASRLAAASSARLGLDPKPHVREVMIRQPEFSVKHWIAIQPLATGEELDDYSSALLHAGLPW